MFGAPPPGISMSHIPPNVPCCWRLVARWRWYPDVTPSVLQMSAPPPNYNMYFMVPPSPPLPFGPPTIPPSTPSQGRAEIPSQTLLTHSTTKESSVSNPETSTTSSSKKSGASHPEMIEATGKMIYILNYSFSIPTMIKYFSSCLAPMFQELDQSSKDLAIYVVTGTPLLGATKRYEIEHKEPLTIYIISNDGNFNQIKNTVTKHMRSMKENIENLWFEGNEGDTLNNLGRNIDIHLKHLTSCFRSPSEISFDVKTTDLKENGSNTTILKIRMGIPSVNRTEQKPELKTYCDLVTIVIPKKEDIIRSSVFNEKQDAFNYASFSNVGNSKFRVAHPSIQRQICEARLQVIEHSAPEFTQLKNHINSIIASIKKDSVPFHYDFKSKGYQGRSGEELIFSASP